MPRRVAFLIVADGVEVVASSLIETFHLATDQWKDLVKLLRGLDVGQYENLLLGGDFMGLTEEAEGELAADAKALLCVAAPARESNFDVLRDGGPVRNVRDVDRRSQDLPGRRAQAFAAFFSVRVPSRDREGKGRKDPLQIADRQP